ncbi:MAG: hypothetical protein HY885_09405 [Deltaproteobacteria bacterium]|nr:hypothetical protein [Deltaproteobacteria bacterium]
MEISKAEHTAGINISKKTATRIADSLLSFQFLLPYSMPVTSAEKNLNKPCHVVKDVEKRKMVAWQPGKK